MAYEVIILCHLHMPLYCIGTFTEYPYLSSCDIAHLFEGVAMFDFVKRLQGLGVVRQTLKHI